VPRLLFEIAKTRSKELFITFVVVMCFAVAWLTNEAGLSLALGAFLAGLVISESEYSHEAAGYILPFKEVFTSIFFVSIRMLLDLSFLVANFLPIMGLTLLTMTIKCTIGIIAARALRVTAKTALMVGLSICQVGEFAFILSKVGMSEGLMPIEIYQYFLAVSVLTMVITPLIITYLRVITSFTILKTPMPKQLRRRLVRSQMKAFNPISTEKELKEHIIVVGYGFTGMNVIRGAKAAEIPYVIVEMNPQTVKDQLRKSEPIVYGDASNDEILLHINAEHAKVAVVTIENTEAAFNVVKSLRSANKDLFIIARVKRAAQIRKMIALGADETIADEYETSLEVFTQTLEQYHVPKFQIYQYANHLREPNEEEV
jgi:CPA2 family monovalent cation:H+ antiporter-2